MPKRYAKDFRRSVCERLVAGFSTAGWSMHQMGHSKARGQRLTGLRLGDGKFMSERTLQARSDQIAGFMGPTDCR